MTSIKSYVDGAVARHSNLSNTISSILKLGDLGPGKLADTKNVENEVFLSIDQILEYAWKENHIAITFSTTQKPIEYVHIGLTAKSKGYFLFVQLVRHVDLKLLCDKLHDSLPGVLFTWVDTIPAERWQQMVRNEKVGVWPRQIADEKVAWYVKLAPSHYRDVLTKDELLHTPCYNVIADPEGHLSFQVWKEPFDYDTDDAKDHMDQSFRYLAGVLDLPILGDKIESKPKKTKLSLNILGEIDMTYVAIEKEFGRPDTGDGYKVDVWWDFQLEDGSRGALHNYKNGPSFLGPSGRNPTTITNWTVRAEDRESLGKILSFLRNLAQLA